MTATFPTEIICRNGTIVLAERFCAPEGRIQLAHELRRMIIETGGDGGR